MNDRSYYTEIAVSITTILAWEGGLSVNTHSHASIYISQCCAVVATYLGIISYVKPFVCVAGVEQWSALWGMISVVGLALVNIYGLIRGTIRQHNLADAEAARETWKGKYELEVESNDIRRRRIEEMQLALKERDSEIEHLRRQLRKSAET